MTEICQKRVWDSFHNHICGKKAAYLDGDGKPACKLHSAAAKAQRELASEMRYTQERAEGEYRWNAKQMFDALLLIAQGHNDPRTLAREAIKPITGDP